MTDEDFEEKAVRNVVKSSHSDWEEQTGCVGTGTRPVAGNGQFRERLMRFLMTFCIRDAFGGCGTADFEAC
jgi:hypothetical protein